MADAEVDEEDRLIMCGLEMDGVVGGAVGGVARSDDELIDLGDALNVLYEKPAKGRKPKSKITGELKVKKAIKPKVKLEKM